MNWPTAWLGRWHIHSMETWTQEFVDAIEPGYFEFEASGLGSFVIGTIGGVMDVHMSHREPMLEFSWLGSAEGHALNGRGVFYFSSPVEGEGTFFIHTGGRSGVSIRRER